MAGFAHRVARRYKLVLSMSMSEAKEILGFPPGAFPSEDEVRKAQRQKVVELGHDRGGDPEKIVEVNVAADILLGKGRPSYDSGPSTTSEPTPTRAPSKPKPIEVSFDEAEAKAGVPTGVNWKFVTETHTSGYSSDEFRNYVTGYVVAGLTDSAWIFVTVENTERADYFVGSNRPSEDIWRITTMRLPRKDPPEPAYVYGGVMKAWKSFDNLKKKFNSKIKILPEGWHFQEKLPASGHSTTIKNWLVDSGLTDEKSLKVPRKMSVKIQYQKSYTDNERKLTLIINGREAEIPKAEAERLKKIRVGGKRFMERVFGDYYYGGEIKDLTKNRDGKLIMKWMAENLNLDSATIEALKVASA